VRKQIPDARTSDVVHLAIDELVEVPFGVNALGGFRALANPRLSFFDSSFFLGGSCVAGFKLSIGFDFSGGRTRRSYTDAPAARERWTDRLPIVGRFLSGRGRG
jgi:hypothetical protein